MDWFSYLTYLSPYNILSTVSEYMQWNTESEEISTDLEEIDHTDKNFLIVYYEYIDEAAYNHHRLEILLYRQKNYGFMSAYIALVNPEKPLTDMLLPIYIKKCSDKVMIKYNDNIYEWYPTKNIVYGKESTILEHFQRKPHFQEI